MKKNLLRICLGLMLTVLVVCKAAGIIQLPVIDQLEVLFYDLRLNMTMPRQQDARIVIVDIDEKSLAEQGRWPWGRDKVARLVGSLVDHYKVGVVGFDVVFAEKDESSGIGVLERLARNEFRHDDAYQQTFAKLRTKLDNDRTFSETIKGRPVVLGYYFTGYEEKEKMRVVGQLPAPVFNENTFKGMGIPFVTSTGYGANLPELQRNAHSAGHINPFVDSDGVCRRIPLLIEYQGKCYESLALAIVRTMLGDPDLVAGVPEGERNGSNYGKLEWLGLSDMKIPVDRYGMALIPFRGPQGSFKYISATDILKGSVNPAELEGAIAIVGATAPALMDMRSSPVAAVYPGAEMQANMVAGILDQNIKHSPAYITAAEMLILLVAGILLSICLPLMSPLKSLLLALVLLIAIIVVNIALWQENIVLPLASSALLVSGLYILNVSYGFFVETRAKRQITSLFGQYVQPELVEEMSIHPERFSMEGESREMTVLFSDVFDFTAHSERLEPKQLAAMMNEYLSTMTRVIQKYRGTIDKYIGDAIMAFWGAPLNDPEHRRNAVRAALEMQIRSVQLWPGFAERGWPPLKIGIGINSGIMNVGNMGSQFRLAYTVMGDAVNLAARLEGLTRQYRVGIIVGEETRNALEDIVFRELDRVTVKGRGEPLKIYEPVGLRDEIGEPLLSELGLYAEMRAAYDSGDWSTSGRIADELLGVSPQNALYSLYRERIEFFRVNPPGGEWDGVFRFKTK